MRYVLALLICTSAIAEEAVKPPAPPPDYEIPASNKPQKKTTEAEVLNSIKSGNKDTSELFLFIALDSVKWPEIVTKKPEPKFARVGNEYVCIIKMSCTKSTQDVIYGICSKVAMQVATLKAIGSPLSRAELHLSTPDQSELGIFRIPLKQAEAMATERETLGDFTLGSFEKFITASDFSGLKALIVK